MSEEDMANFGAGDHEIGAGGQTMEQLLNIVDFVAEGAHPPFLSSPMPMVRYMIRMHPNYDLKAEKQLHDRGVSACVPKEQRTIKGA